MKSDAPSSSGSPPGSRFERLPRTFGSEPKDRAELVELPEIDHYEFRVPAPEETPMVAGGN